MSGKLPKAHLNHLHDFKNGGALELVKATISCTACLKTSSFNPRNSSGEMLRDCEDAGLVCGILSLPGHIMIDIFSRLPLKQVFLCRSTCKTFSRILSRPNYNVLCLDKAQPCLLLREFSRKCFPNFFNREAYVSELADETPSTFFYSKAHLVDLEEVESHADYANSPVNPSVLVKHEIFSLPAGKLEMVGSCNGLVCLYQQKTAQYYVCNPLLGEWTILPPPSYESTINATSSAAYSLFGFCLKTKKYKIIRFMSSSVLSSSSSAAVEIITVGASAWRYIGDGPRPKAQGSFSLCQAGDIIFTTQIPKDSTIICSFSLETEQFHLIPSPPNFTPDYVKKLSWVNVGTMHNSLCICYIHNESTLELWTSDNKSVTNPSWIRKSSVSFRYWNLLFRMDKHHPSIFLDENYDLWLKHQGTRNLYKFSPQEDEMRAFRVSGSGTGFEIIAHIPSFVKLEDALMLNEEPLEVFRYGYKLWSP